MKLERDVTPNLFFWFACPFITLFSTFFHLEVISKLSQLIESSLLNDNQKKKVEGNANCTGCQKLSHVLRKSCSTQKICKRTKKKALLQNLIRFFFFFFSFQYSISQLYNCKNLDCFKYTTCCGFRFAFKIAFRFAGHKT